MINYQNGNVDVTLHECGTRVIEYEGELRLDQPLNIDIRVSNRCAFGLNPKSPYVKYLKFEIVEL